MKQFCKRQPCATMCNISYAYDILFNDVPWKQEVNKCTEAVLLLYNLQQINMWRGHFFSSAVIKYFRWVKPTDSFSWKDHQWYCVKTCRAASGWQCDERLGGAETHVAQPISSELCNVRDEQMCAAVKDVCNNSTEQYPPVLRWIPVPVMSSPLSTTSPLPAAGGISLLWWGIWDIMWVPFQDR